MTFGERVKAALTFRGLTQGQLELHAQVDQGHISAIINNKKIPRVDVAARLALALNTSLDWLTGLPRHEAEALEPDEDAILRIYRSAPDRATKDELLDLMRTLAKRWQNE